MLAIAQLIIRIGPGSPAVTLEARPARYRVKIGVRIGALGVIDPASPVVRGLTGAQGEAGPQGVKGDKGDPGDTGATGPQGPAGSSSPDRARAVVIESDFFDSAAYAVPGLFGVATSSGTVGGVAGTADHPGVIYLRDSTTENGGYRFMTPSASAFLLAGGERAELIFQARSARATASARFGWQDSTAINTQPTDGAWVEITGDGTAAVILGRCKNNAGPSSTGTYTLGLNTWFRVVIEVNADATAVVFTLYSESGTQLWQSSVNANIPVVAGRETGFGLIVGETSTDAAADILHVDYMNMTISRALTR
jgi:hypothetical protein